MGAIEEVATMLKAAGLGSIGQATASTGPATIFLRALPECDGIAISLVETPGGPPVRTYARGVPAVESIGIDLLVRTTAPAAGSPQPLSTGAYSVARRAWAAAEGVSNEALSGTQYLRISGPASGPYLFDRDAASRLIFRCPLQAMRVPSSTGG